MYKEDLALNNLQALICHKISINLYKKCFRCNGHLGRKWIRQTKFKSWTSLFTSHNANTLRKGMNLIMLPPAMYK